MGSAKRSKVERQSSAHTQSSVWCECILAYVAATPTPLVVPPDNYSGSVRLSKNTAGVRQCPPTSLHAGFKQYTSSNLRGFREITSPPTRKMNGLFYINQRNPDTLEIPRQSSAHRRVGSKRTGLRALRRHQSRFATYLH